MTLYNCEISFGYLKIVILINVTDNQPVFQKLYNKIDNDEEIRKLFEDVLKTDESHAKQMLKYSVDWFKYGFLEFYNSKFSTVGFDTIINVYLNRLSMDELKNIIPDKEYREKDEIVIYWLLDYFKKIYIKPSELIKIEKITEIKDDYYIIKIKDNNDD